MNKQYHKVAIAALLFLGSTLTYCTSSKKTSTTTPTPMAGAPTYAKDVAPIMEANCAPCHFPSQGGKVEALDNYAAVKGEVNGILKRINKNPGEPGFMPLNHDKLSAETIATIQKWRDGGLQQ